MKLTVAGGDQVAHLRVLGLGVLKELFFLVKSLLLLSSDFQPSCVLAAVFLLGV